MRIAAALAIFFCLGFATQQVDADSAPRWKAVLVAGDDSISVFDNAVTRIGALLAAKGVDQRRALTSDEFLSGPERPLATSKSIEAALADLAVGGFDRCLVYVTSHGDQSGVLLRREDRQPRRLTPNRLGRILDRQCGDKPTVVVVSACHSGVFIAASTSLPNRIILTAARDDRTSFGCGAEFEFTYFDQCVIDAWPKAKTWRVLFDATESCVRKREAETKQKPSLPQSFFGADVQDLAMP